MKINFDQLIKKQQNPSNRFYQSQFNVNGKDSNNLPKHEKDNTNKIKTTSFAEVQNSFITNMTTHKNSPNKQQMAQNKFLIININNSISYRKDKPFKQTLKQTQSMKMKINKVTEALAKPKQTCNKKKCSKIVAEEAQKKYVENFLIKKQKFIPHVNNSKYLDNDSYYIKNVKSSSLQNLNKSKQKPDIFNNATIHDKLYAQYKKRQYRQIQIHEIQQISKQYERQLNIRSTPQHLRTYTKFYDRLEYLVTKKKLKQKYYDTCGNLQKIRQTSNSFHPNISQSQKSFKMKSAIIPKFGKHIQKKIIQQNLLNNTTSNAYSHKKSKKKNYSCLQDTLNTSLQSLDRSVQIVQKTQQKFIIKICSYLEDEGFFTISPQNIKMLSDVEFQILFPLISQLEDAQTMTIYQFQQKLRKFYKNLPTKQKQQLRSHQSRINRGKNSKIQSHKLNFSTSDIHIQHQKNLQKSKQSRIPQYIKKLQVFI